MKKTAGNLFLILALSLTFSSAWSQKKTALDGLWLRADTLINTANQPRAALSLLDTITAIARKQHQNDELIRASVYRLSLQQTIQDEEPGHYMLFVDSLVKAADGPVERSLLTVLKARLLIAIYNRDRRKIMSRTVIQGGQPDETRIAYWTTADFQIKIHDLYTQALAPATLLQQSPTKKYDAVINKGNTPLLRPTLYDLIMQDAIAYYSSGLADESPSEPGYVLEDPQLLAGAAAFATHKFIQPEASDSLNSTWIQLGYYQALIAFHLKDKDPLALADLDLERLDWAHDVLTEQAPDKYKDEYRAALEKAIKAYEGTDAALYGAFQLADTYADDASNYNAAEDTAHRYDYVSALKIIERFQPRLDQALEASAGTKDKNKLSPGAAGLLNLKNRILAPGINLEMESVNTPDEPMRVLVKFSNVPKLYFRVLQVPVSMESLDLTDSLWKVLVNRTPLKHFSQALPATGDYQQHAVEIKVPALGKGSYLLLASANPAFHTDSNLTAVHFNVSRLAYVSQGADMFFVDRKTGRPLNGVEVRFYDKTWKKDRYKYLLNTSMRTDKDGRVTMRKENNGSFSVMAVYDEDSLTSNASFYQVYRYRNNDDESEAQKSLLFYLDRSIYRPGQQVFFKGVATIIYPDVRGRKLLKDERPHKIYLYDANGQKADSVSLTLNDYGALSGNFTLPAGRLPGSYALGAEDFQGRQYFQVEEYKRPTYVVNFDTLKAAVALGDSVTVKGQAMAYSGYPISGAKVNIVVTRNVYFPYSWYRYVPNVSPSPIAHGTVITDDKGHFEFTFKALEGEKSWNRLMPNYHYTVAATSTDQNGETREARTLIVVGSQPFNLSVGIPEDTPGDLLDTLNLVTTTAGGQFIPQQVSLRITKLQAPQRLLRARLWQTPDLTVIDSASFVQDFPNDPYMDETNKDFWKRGAVVYNEQVMTNKTGKIGLNKKIGPGWYEITSEAPGTHGQTIKDRKYVYLYNAKTPLVAPEYNWSDRGQTELLPGERSGITLASSAREQYVIYSTTRMPRNKQVQSYGHLTIGEKPVLLPLSLTEKEVHGAALNYVFVRDSRQYTGNLTVCLKDTATLPEIVYESFRDKTEPGSKEHWVLHINKGKERLKDMELLSSMYDASLDQFTMHNWSLPGMDNGNRVYPGYWQTGQMFSIANSRSNSILNTNYTSVKTYDRLIYDQYLERKGPGRILMGRVPGLRASDEISGQDARIMVRGAKALTPMNEVMVTGYAPVSKESLTANVKVVDNSISGPVRSDFRETAFFFPQLHSDSHGNYTIDFQMPDALTTWKWMNLAYDKELHMVKSQKKVITQKTLMVVPNLPRFVRNGDHWTLSAKVVNLSKMAISGNVSLDIEDPVTGQKLNWMGSDNMDKSVTVQANGTATVRFDIVQPTDFNGPVNITVQAKGGEYSDAEKNMIPVLTNKMQVTETLPIYLKEDGEKTFTLDKLLSFTGKDKESKQLVLELTTNPIWNVVTALPDIQIGEKPNGMDVLNKLYADAMGAYVMRTYPAITKVIRQWSTDTAAENSALLSALEKNPDLKSVLLQQTPWVMDASDETAQHKALVRFLNKRVLDSSQRVLVTRLLSLQDDNGGFSWFSGGRPDITSTQNILTGIHQLMRDKLKNPALAIPLSKIAGDASQYLNAYYTMEYEKWHTKQIQAASEMKKGDKPDSIYPIGSREIQYLYAVSLNPETAQLNEMQEFFLGEEKKNWQSRPVYLQLMIAATQYRMGDKAFAVNTIMQSLLDRTVRDENIGMYWKKNTRYYNWYENPLRAQALAISLLTEIGTDAAHSEWQSYVNEMMRYLIGQKQVNRWPSTTTTIDACVAMIDAAPENFTVDRSINVKLGNKKLDLKQQTGTGYIRYVVNAKDIQPSMGKVKVDVKGVGDQTAVPIYGALYWQYVSAMSSVEAAAKTPGITLLKGLYREINTNGGTRLVAVKATDVLHVGDKLVSRLTINLDRDMDYVHLREMRAAGVQPDQTISGYLFNDGLSYYQTVGDLATNLYFDHIAKGSYVIEYPVHVSHAGSFEAGTATMESFYSPEFATHTEGIRIKSEQ